MTIVDITEENLEEYRDAVPSEYMENIGREYGHGLIGMHAETDRVNAAICWEVKNAERESVDNAAEIGYFRAESEEDAQLLLDAFCTRCSYDRVVTVFFEFEDLREHEAAAFAAKGFAMKQTEGMDIYVTVEEMTGLFMAKSKPPFYVKRLSDITRFQLKAGIMNSVFHERYGLLDDLPFLPMSWYDLNVSCCVLTDDKVAGILLVHRVKEGLYRVELLFSEKLDAAANVRDMIIFSIQAAGECCSPEDRFLIRRHNHTVAELVKKLFPVKKGNTVTRGIRKEK